MRFFFILTLFLNLTATAGTFKENQIDPIVSRATDWTSLKIVLAGAASVVLVRPYDDDIRSDWKNHQKMTESQAHTGDILGSGAVGVLAVSAQYLWDTDENNYQSHARGLVSSTLVNFALKNIFSRPRPNNYDRLSFPSGHTMTSFMTATSLTYAYGWKAAAVAYPVATFIGLSRLSDDAHWGSDVVAGAFVGILMARASFYQLDQSDASADKKQSFAVYPALDPGSTGFHFIYSF